MSTDVYFDVGDGEDKHEPCRIGYLYNFIVDENYERFDDFHVLCAGQVTAEKIPQIVTSFRRMFDYAQAAPTNPFRDDVCTPVEIEEILHEHIGLCLRVRVD
jgi:hypothetical protein